MATSPSLARAGKSESGVKRQSFGANPFLLAAVTATALLGLSALVNHRLARKAERKNPPRGRFVEVGGVRLHMYEQGQGEPLVLLHGNGSMVEDFLSSGLIDMAASRYRVIAFDRPGHGHSARPGEAAWTDVAQAEVIAAALAEMGISRAVVLGHSWGSSVALALALNHPDAVSALVLASGYYYPSMRTDVVVAAGLNVPVLGALMRHAVLPWLARATWPLVLRKLFGPTPTPPKFGAFPREMAFRPSQLRASLADAALMVPDAAARERRYGEITKPVVIIAGDADRLVEIDEQSGRLHAGLAQSRLRRIPGAGHMIHQIETDAVMSAIDEAADLMKRQSTVAASPADRERLSAAE